MQKKVIAALVGALISAPAAFADSQNVVISGLFKGGFENYKLSGGSAASYDNEMRVSDQSSRLIFSMSEDLGAGLKAWAQLDTRFSLDTGGNNAAGSNLFATGNSGIGLAGGWGKLTVGRWDLHYTEFGAIEANRAGSLQTYMQAGPLAQVNGTNSMNPTRTPNVLMFDTANYSGFTGRAAYSTNVGGNEGSGVGTDGSKDGALTLAGRWTSGPMTVGGSWWKNNAEGTTDVGDQRSQRAWFGWNQPMGGNSLKAGLGYDRSEVRFTAGGSTTKRNGWLIPVAYTIGSEALYFTFAKMDKTSGGLATGTTSHDNTDANAYLLGWDHAFSKRTSGGVYLTKVNNKANASYDMFGLTQNGGTATAFGEDAQQLYFGLAHSF
jgi:general bacterial porin, GBP family